MSCFDYNDTDPLDPEIIRDIIASSVVLAKDKNFSLMVNVRVPTEEGIYKKVKRMFYNAVILDPLDDIEHTTSIPHWIEIVHHETIFGLSDWYCKVSAILQTEIDNYNNGMQSA